MSRYAKDCEELVAEIERIGAFEASGAEPVSIARQKGEWVNRLNELIDRFNSDADAVEALMDKGREYGAIE